jgi:hypothetical protein
VANVVFQETSPVMYQGEVTNGARPHIIIFNEMYSPQWELSLQSPISSNTKIEHFTINSYANAWYIEGAESEYKFTIKYKPQTLLKIGGILTAISILLALLYVIYEQLLKKNERSR